jgi:hypothetical protein
VLQLRKLDLQLAFERARALREDVEDQAAAVEHAALELLFEVALLARAQRAVDDDEVAPERDDAPRTSCTLPVPIRKRGIGRLARRR